MELEIIWTSVKRFPPKFPSQNLTVYLGCKLFPGKTSHLLECCSAHYISLVFLRKSRSIFTSACEYSKNICTTTKDFKVRGRATFFAGQAAFSLFSFMNGFQYLLIFFYCYFFLPPLAHAQNSTTRDPTRQLQSQGGERESKTYRSQKYGSTLEKERDNLREV